MQKTLAGLDDDALKPRKQMFELSNYVKERQKEGCPTSLQTSMVPKTICRPSKKLSPMMMTVVPPVVQPSLGQIALIHGVAVKRNDI